MTVLKELHLEVRPLGQKVSWVRVEACWMTVHSVHAWADTELTKGFKRIGNVVLNNERF